MAQSVLELLLRTRKVGEAVGKEVANDLKGLNQQLDTNKKKFDENYGAIRDYALAGGAALAAFAAQAIKRASDVAESSSKFTTVFKGESQAVEAELDTLANTINRSKFDLIDYASTFQDTFVPMGFAREEATKLSVNLVKLAEDLASFNNLDTADVTRDLQSALVGNTETLRKYGVVANEANIQQKALEMGLWDGKGAIDAQTKALAIYQLTMEGTTDAQGDAERTADGFANTMRGAQASLDELNVVMGQKLLPTATAFVKTMGEGIEVLTLLVTWNDRVKASLAEHEAAIRTTSDGYDAYRAEAVRAAEAAGYLVDEQGNMLRLNATAGIMEIVQANYVMSESLYTASQSVSLLMDDEKRLIGTNYDVAGSFEISKEQLALNRDEVDKLAKLMGGAVGNELQNFADKQTELKDKAEEYRLKIEELEKKPYLSGAQKQQLEDAKKGLGEVNDALDDNAAKHEEATRRIVFSILQQQAAVDGFTTEEVAALTTVAEKWGLIDPATKQATDAVSQALQEAANTGEWDSFYTKIDTATNKLLGIPTSITTTLTLNYQTNGTPNPQQGDIGLPGGDSAPVIITNPDEDDGSGGGGSGGGGSGEDGLVGQQRVGQQSVGGSAARGEGGGSGGYTIIINVDARGALDVAGVEAAGYRGALRALQEAGVNAAARRSMR